MAANLFHEDLFEIFMPSQKFGQDLCSCRVCSNRHGLIRKYGLNLCWQCFRQYAKDVGFIQLDQAEGFT
uniref:Small ribosomal subunit protein uS14 n=1 Tax=Salvator merianae TaxID=96440 RepID=A0A8D0DTR0_SALMN